MPDSNRRRSVLAAWGVMGLIQSALFPLWLTSPSKILIVALTCFSTLVLITGECSILLSRIEHTKGIYIRIQQTIFAAHRKSAVYMGLSVFALGFMILKAWSWILGTFGVFYIGLCALGAAYGTVEDDVREEEVQTTLGNAAAQACYDSMSSRYGATEDLHL